MKKYILLILLFITYLSMENISGQSVAISNNQTIPDASAMLDISSTSKGMLMPRMTMQQRNSISNPATGLIIFQTDDAAGFYFNAGTAGAPNWTRVETVSGGGGGVWATSGTDIYAVNTGRVGIGTSAPAYSLHINRADPAIGFTDADDNHFSGSIQGDSANLVIHAYRKNAFNNNAAGNIILQTSSSLLTAGRVGIGTGSPTEKLDIAGNLKASGTMTAGGHITAYGNMYADNIYAEGKILRPASGPNNLVPLAYGKINGFQGTNIGGTPNYTVTRNGPGDYSITLLGESNMYQFTEQYIILLTPYTSVPRMMVSEIESNNTIRVRIAKPAVHYTNSACSCELFSRITDAAFYDYQDCDFSFLVYKR